MEIHLKKSVPHRFKSVGIWFEFGPYGSLSDISNSEYLNEWVLIELHAWLLLFFRYLNLFPCIYNSWNSGNELLFRIDSTRFAFFLSPIDIYHNRYFPCFRIELPTKSNWIAYKMSHILHIHDQIRCHFRCFPIKLLQVYAIFPA